MRTLSGTSPRRLDIQGLRTVAVVAVVAFHAGLPVRGGFLGVDVFFVISGFVICGMILRQADHSQFSMSTFYIRRFRRLTPALALVVSATVVASLVVLSPLGPQQVAAKTGLGALFLSANFVIAATTGGYFDLVAGTNPLLNTWSLSVEEQFYLVFPSLLLAALAIARRKSGMRSAPVVALSVVALGSLALALCPASDGWPTPWSYLVGFYGPLSRGWEFGAGAILALLMHRRNAVKPLFGTALSLIGMSLVLVSVVLLPRSSQIPGPALLVPVLGTVLLLWAGASAGNPVSRLLSVRPMVRVGDWSYSWYLWHWPLIVFTALILPGRPIVLAVVALGSLIPAAAAFHLLEQPIREQRSLAFGFVARTVAVVVAPPVVLAIALLVAANHGLWNAELQRLQAGLAPHAGWRCLSKGTMTGDRSSMYRLGDCTWGGGLPGAPIYLVGDSHAGALSEAVIGAGQLLDRPVVVDNASQCPFLDVFLSPAESPFGAADRLCRERYENLMKDLGTTAPGTVVIANSDIYWWDDATAAGASEASRVTTEASKAPVLEEGLVRTASMVAAMGHQVVLVQPVLRFDMPPLNWSVASCTGYQVLAGTCVGSVKRTQLQVMQQVPRRAVELAASDSGAGVIDLRDDLCDENACRTSEGDRQIYMDSAHISVNESSELAGRLAELISGRSTS